MSSTPSDHAKALELTLISFAFSELRELRYNLHPRVFPHWPDDPSGVVVSPPFLPVVEIACRGLSSSLPIPHLASTPRIRAAAALPGLPLKKKTSTHVRCHQLKGGLQFQVLLLRIALSPRGVVAGGDANE